MNFALCPSIRKLNSLNYIEPISAYLLSQNASVFIDPEFAAETNLQPITKDTPIDIFITLGGDGTLLWYKNKYLTYKESAFVGINFGHLGFMADVLSDDYISYLKDLLEKNYKVEERAMLTTSDSEGNIYHALNDIAVYRGCIKTMIQLRITINDEYFKSVFADGLIVATPTGSTAYSTAAGGSILDPLLNGMILTPVSAHSLTSRPYITPLTSRIRIEYTSDNDPIDVASDGIRSFPLSQGSSIEISKSPETFKLITFPHKHTFYRTLRSKLHWGV